MRVNPDRIEILSYPGSDPSISLKALAGKKVISRRYRNRRIGEFLKELDLTEGRATGIPKIYDALQSNVRRRRASRPTKRAPISSSKS